MIQPSWSGCLEASSETVFWDFLLLVGREPGAQPTGALGETLNCVDPEKFLACRDPWTPWGKGSIENSGLLSSCFAWNVRTSSILKFGPSFWCPEVEWVFGRCFHRQGWLTHCLPSLGVDHLKTQWWRINQQMRKATLYATRDSPAVRRGRNQNNQK